MSTETAVVGIDLGGTKCHGALGDAAGNILAEVRIGTVSAGASTALTGVWDLLRREAEDRGIRIGHATVGIPAVFNPVTGQATQGVNIGWEGFDVSGVVGAFDIPVHVDNDANLAGIAEAGLGHAVGVPNFALLSLGTGFGGALFAGGSLVRGRRGAAAEFGDILVADPEHPSVMVRAEDRVSGLALRDSARALAESDAEAHAELGRDPTAKTVITGALQGGRHAGRLVEDALDALATTVTGICATLDPDLIILDGGLGRALAPFARPLTLRLAERGMNPPPVRVSTLQPNATVVGALLHSVRALRT
ncbi:ROK family protein [Rhizohabitans arisaemae]|uniref:ROK family protein n=1 Tax=Rhizohabitans arisaemae TaxID=2720610 RepID=UPI0024B0FB80|nr:ROK family protein [Rhizohabitans arisaemae]